MLFTYPFMPLLSFLRRRSSLANPKESTITNSMSSSSNNWARPPSIFSSSQDWSQPPPTYEQAVDRTDNADLLLGENKAPIKDKRGRTDANGGAGSSSSSTTGHSSDQISKAALMTLAKYDTVIIVDDSGSMMLPHGYAVSSKDLDAQDTSRWAVVRKVICDLSEMLCKYDKDGIGLHFLNNEEASRANLKSKKEVLKAFDATSPSVMNITNIGGCLDDLLMAYRRRVCSTRSVKKVNYIIITDGDPTDDPEYVINAHASWLDQQHLPLDQVGIQFFQIGNDPRATEYLKELDDHLDAGSKALRDMVDTTQYEGEMLTAERLIKICVGGINRKYDRMRPATHE